MKLLFDQNLSWRLPQHLAELYPQSLHIREIGLLESEDIDIWEYAKANGFVIVTKDKDFQQRSWLYGHPPKVIHLLVGNCTVEMIEVLLKKHSAIIHKFISDKTKSYLALQ
jgi:predicted nuclease of predicted toxin-antitoxin system